MAVSKRSAQRPAAPNRNKPFELVTQAEYNREQRYQSRNKSHGRGAKRDRSR
jgi:hypothetical protein